MDDKHLEQERLAYREHFKDEYKELVERFKRMFDSNDDEFRWTLLKMNRGIDYMVILDNDDTIVRIQDEDDEWVGRFTNYIGNSIGVVKLLNSMKIPSEFC